MSYHSPVSIMCIAASSLLSTFALSTPMLRTQGLSLPMWLFVVADPYHGFIMYHNVKLNL